MAIWDRASSSGFVVNAEQNEREFLCPGRENRGGRAGCENFPEPRNTLARVCARNTGVLGLLFLVPNCQRSRTGGCVRIKKQTNKEQFACKVWKEEGAQSSMDGGR